MSFGVRARITQNRYAELLKQARRGATRWNEKNADEGAAEERRTVHVASGATRDSIHVETNATTGSASILTGEGAMFEEFGTVFRGPHPFKLPAAVKQAGKMRGGRVVLYGR